MDGLKYDVVEIQSQANMFAFWYGLVVGSDLNFFGLVLTEIQRSIKM